MEFVLCLVFSLNGLALCLSDIERMEVPLWRLYGHFGLMVVFCIFFEAGHAGIFFDRILGASFMGFVFFIAWKVCCNWGGIGIGDVQYSLCVGFFCGLHGSFIALTFMLALAALLFLYEGFMKGGNGEVCEKCIPFIPIMFFSSIFAFLIMQGVL